MKAKVIETGETIDITIFLDRFGGPKRYWDSKNKKEYSKSQLDFNIDTQISKETIEPIDWEQRRYEIAKDIMAASFNQPMSGVSIASYAHICVLWADAIIEELKKTSK